MNKKEVDINLHGSWRSDDSWTAFEPAILACASRFEMYDGTVQGGTDDCEWDFDAVKDYIGPGPRMLILFNQKEFKSNQYGDERIERKAVLHSV